MPVREVLLLGNPRLRQKSGPVSSFVSDWPQIREDLNDTLAELQQRYSRGRALAAPQIGYPVQAICFRLPERHFFMVNPEYRQLSQDTFEVWDDCFSFNMAFLVKIRRFRSLTLAWRDETGGHHCECFKEDLAELIQHEIDHLFGILAIDHLTDSRDLVMRQEYEDHLRQR